MDPPRHAHGLLGLPEDDAQVQAAHAEVLEHSAVRSLIADAAAWELTPIRRHNDAGHPLQKLAVLADSGLHAGDPVVAGLLRPQLARQSADGASLSLAEIPAGFGAWG